MKKIGWILFGLGILCIAVAVVVCLLNGENTPESPATDPAETTQVTTVDTTLPETPDEPVVPPESDLPPVVEIPAETDPSTGENKGISFPCTVPEHGLVIEKLDAFQGMFVEDGTNAQLSNVAMLLVRNDSTTPLEYTQLRVKFAKEELLFDISALPVGERLVVQEKNAKPLPAGKPLSANALVIHRAELTMDSQVQVTDNGDNTLSVTNLTAETIPTVRVFYKYYMEDEKIFVGGIAFTVRITRLAPGATVKLQPSHYTSQSGRVVMVLTYDSEV